MSLPVEESDLHTSPERLDDGVVIAVADRTHQGDETGLADPVGKHPEADQPSADAAAIRERAAPAAEKYAGRKSLRTHVRSVWKFTNSDFFDCNQSQ